MKLKRHLFLWVTLAVLLALCSASQARLLHESTRIALYSTEAEPGSHNSHPIAVKADQIATALSRFKAHSGDTGEIIELFPEKNRTELAGQLAKVFSSIDQGQDLHIVSFRRIGNFLSGHRNASAARVFIESGRLNLIFGQIDLFFSEFRDPDKPVPPMGSRERTAVLKGSILPTQGIVFADGRNDWVIIDLDQSVSPPSAEAPAIKRSSERSEETSPRAAYHPKKRSIEERLQILKNLKNKDLITQQEYVEKKRQILDDL